MRRKPVKEHPFAVVATRGGVGGRPITVATAATFDDARRAKRRLQRENAAGWPRKFRQLTVVRRPHRARAA